MKKITVSIGIPALNEENTIQQLLLSILSQVQVGFRLEHIYVVLDGSTDHTKDEIQKVGDTHIVTLTHSKQLGKASRLNELFKKNTSDILIIFDADILIRDRLVLKAMLEGFADPAVGLISANNLPIRPKEFLGKIWHRAEMLWYEMRKYSDNSKTLFNNSGCSIAIRGNIAKQIVLPKETIADQQFVYMYVHKLGSKFYFAKTSNIYYHPPATLKDISIQYARSTTEEPFFQKHFGHVYDSYFTIPFRLKLRGMVESFIEDPIYTLLAMTFLKMLPFTSYITLHETKKGLWPVTASTKKGFDI